MDMQLMCSTLYLSLSWRDANQHKRSAQMNPENSRTKTCRVIYINSSSTSETLPATIARISEPTLDCGSSRMICPSTVIVAAVIGMTGAAGIGTG